MICSTVVSCEVELTPSYRKGKNTALCGKIGKKTCKVVFWVVGRAINHTSLGWRVKRGWE